MYGGIYSAVAEQLGVTRQAISKRVQADEELKMICEEARETLVDLAEFGLREAITRKDAWSIRFVLATLGKTRGYSQVLKVEGEMNQTGQVVIYIPSNGRDDVPSEPDSASTKASKKNIAN